MIFVSKRCLNIIIENVQFSFVSFGGLKLDRPVSAVWFDSNTVGMTTVRHYMYLTKFCELLACHCLMRF